MSLCALGCFSHASSFVANKGTHDGRPRYVERNKENGGVFKHVSPAEIIFCGKIEAWVFRHKNIRTSLDNDYEVSSSHSLSLLGQYLRYLSLACIFCRIHALG
jgi:hypothetical protein